MGGFAREGRSGRASKICVRYELRTFGLVVDLFLLLCFLPPTATGGGGGSLSVRVRVSTWLLSFLAVVALMTPGGWRLFSSLHLDRFDVQMVYRFFLYVNVPAGGEVGYCPHFFFLRDGSWLRWFDLFPCLKVDRCSGADGGYYGFGR